MSARTQNAPRLILATNKLGKWCAHALRTQHHRVCLVQMNYPAAAANKFGPALYLGRGVFIKGKSYQPAGLFAFIRGKTKRVGRVLLYACVCCMCACDLADCLITLAPNLASERERERTAAPLLLRFEMPLHNS
jgi:hypothetical protein